MGIIRESADFDFRALGMEIGCKLLHIPMLVKHSPFSSCTEKPLKFCGVQQGVPLFEIFCLAEITIFAVLL